MALSQIQCLDDNNVNPRTNESKPDFFYSEDQRLALEVLLRDGREPFLEYLKERQMRRFLSDMEQETLTKTLEPYDPGSELFPEAAEENEPPLSLHYWPELSELSIPQMDLGWPQTEAYRGVTRTAVYAQPPLEGQTHIKEVVRRMIAQAQKVIAVVMDVFTDVDIFRDLLDAGFRRKVSVYILLESTSLPHFLSMCQRANMHAGHLKHLRVRCTAGSEFYTRSSTMVKGRLGHRFMFIDGDKAVSGSFSFTWMSSRLDKNLVTVVTGQAVEAFDHLFRHIYMTSVFVDLQQVATDPEPEREPLPQLAPVALPSATTTRKLYNPKYALLIGENANPTSVDQASHKESQTPEVPDTKKRRQRRGSKEPGQEEESIHPGLVNLEKANLIPYLPTWPEPDPPSDVIGFINIMDTSKPTQVHLQRSERFETSQAIRFKNPLTTPKEVVSEVVSEVAKPGVTHSKIEKTNPPPLQDRIKVKESVYDRLQHMDSTSTKVTSQNESQTMKRVSPLSSSNEHINRSTSNMEQPSQQKNRISAKTGSSSYPATQSPFLLNASNSGTKHTATKTTPHIIQANHTVDTSHPSTSSSSSSNNQTLKPHTIHQDTKDGNVSNGLGMPNSSTLKRLNSLTTDNKVAVHKSTGENKQQTVTKMHENSNRKTGLQKDDRKSDSFQKNQQHHQKETSAGSQNKTSVGRHDGKGGTPGVSGSNKQIQSDAVAALTPNRDSVHIQEKNSDDIKYVRTVDCDRGLKPQKNLVATVESDSKTTSRQLTDPKSPKILNENESEKKTYHVKENKPQRISYTLSSPLTMWERIQAAMIEPSNDGMDNTSGKLYDEHTANSAKNTRRVSQENPQSPKEQILSHTPEKALPDSPAFTPDFRTPTSDKSGRRRSIDGSYRSTTSEDHVEYGSHSTADNYNPSNTQTNTSNKGATSPLFIDYSAYVTLFNNKDKHTSSKGTQGLESKVKMREKEDVKSKDSGIKNASNGDSKGKEGRNSEESKPKTFEKDKESQNQAVMRKSRYQRATGSNKEVAGQKLKATAPPKRPISAPVSKTERKATRSTSEVFDYLSSSHNESLGQPPS
ncbi:uncharacterized protein LOC144044499 [Vanacampus margaritifer]